jgi:hypothetical protein
MMFEPVTLREPYRRDFVFNPAFVAFQAPDVRPSEKLAFLRDAAPRGPLIEPPLRTPKVPVAGCLTDLAFRADDWLRAHQIAKALVDLTVLAGVIFVFFQAIALLPGVS